MCGEVDAKSLAQNAIITFYKCFGKNEFRYNSLRRDKILAGYPSEAKNVFDYYRDLRNKFIAHDESRFSQANAGVILETKKEAPFVDTFCTVAVAEKFKSVEERQGLSSLYQLILAAIQWVELKIDELRDLLEEKYKEKTISEFQELEPLKLNIPSQEEIYKKRN